MDFTEAVRLESFPLKPCVHCGLQFGASSVVLHQQNCRQQSSREKSERSKKKSRCLRSRRDDTHRECDTVERAVERGDETGSHMISLSLNPSKEAAANLKPFGSPCRFCGERFGRHSLHLHEKRCRDQDLSSTYKNTGSRSKRKSNERIAIPADNSSDLVDTAEEVRHSTDNRVPGVHVLFDLPPRPQTRTLERSVLVEKGYSLPTVEAAQSSNTSRTQCDICGKLIASDIAAVHHRICRPQPMSVARGSIKFPSLPQKSKTTRNSSRKNERSQETTAELPTGSVDKVVRRLPTVVCYICGREYGSKSISIHEPQCLKKFETENRKLPISERKPLPKKPVHHVALVVTVASTERVIIRPAGIYRNDVLQDTTDQYFQNCYSEWERDLIPCKMCGRKFAPERHVKHEYRCKAKPLANVSASRTKGMK